MKFAKISVILAGILLGTSGLVSCVTDGAKQPSPPPSSTNERLESPDVGCVDPNVTNGD